MTSVLPPVPSAETFPVRFVLASLGCFSHDFLALERPFVFVLLREIDPRVENQKCCERPAVVQRWRTAADLR